MKKAGNGQRAGGLSKIPFVNRVRKLLFWPMVRPTNLQTLTVTPAVLHSLRDAIAASAAPIYRIRIWGIFEDRQQYVVTSSLQHRDAGEQYYKEHKTKDARTAEKPGMTVYQQVRFAGFETCSREQESTQ